MRKSLSLSSAVLAILAAAVASEAGASSSSPSSVDKYYGSFGTKVPIAVPKYHGIEPKLALVYSSTSQNTWIGLGWSLGGTSFIERTSSSGRGVPQYDSSDTFLLDGQQLVADTSLGGTHSVRIQDYTRIVRDGGLDRFTIYRKDGTKATYTPLVVNASGTYRWALASVVDTHGNTVNYTYWCEAGADCYLDTISYNRTLIKFYSEARPDPIIYANGHDLSRTNYRLKTVDVQVQDVDDVWKRVRAYSLTYTPSIDTSQSLLTNAQQFGRDANVDGNGVVTGGTSLPAMTFGYGDTSFSTNGANLPSMGYQRVATAGDFNGDGKTDVLRYNTDWNTLQPTSIEPGPLGSQPLTGPSRRLKYECMDGGISTYRYGHNRLHAGDFNGDGRTDLAFVEGVNATTPMSIYLGQSNGTFAAPVAGPSRWVNNDCGKAEMDINRVFVGDFNGDGNTDIGAVEGYNSTAAISIYLSQGDGTFAAAVAGPTRTIGDVYASIDIGRVFAGDFDGDGNTDIAAVEGWGGWANMSIYKSRGDGTFDPATSGPSFYMSNTEPGKSLRALRVGDFNGDTKLDIMDAGSNTGGLPETVVVHLSTGDGFTSVTNTFGSGCPGTGCDCGPGGCPQGATAWEGLNQVADINGDGRADLVVAVLTGYGTYDCYDTVFFSKGDGTFTSGVAASWELMEGYLVLGDFNGDGKQDFFINSSTPTIYTTTGKLLKMSSVDNGLGGTTTITYAPSSAWSNQEMPNGASTAQLTSHDGTWTTAYLPSGLVMQTVASLETCDGRGSCSTTTYQYEGGLWSWSERRFLGFRKVTGVIDAAGNYTETYYHQHVGCISKPESTYFKTALGKIYSYSEYQYSENSSPPYTSLMTERWDYQCEQGTTCQRVVVQIGYDTYGNAILTKEHGNYDAPGDERTKARGYFPNTTDYIVGLPAYENVYAGIGTGGQLMQSMRYVYDDNTSYDQAPSVGERKKLRKWDSETGGFLDTVYTFDAYGNETAETDPASNSTTATFDSTFNIYPVQACDRAGHCMSQAWDYVMGQATSRTDINNNTVSYAHDALGRRTSETRPGGAQLQWSYLDWGDPNQQRVCQILPDGSPDGLWECSYFDGIQRKYKMVKEGNLTRLRQYTDASTRVWKESLWFDADVASTPSYIVYAYDGPGRQRQITNPDGTYAQTVYEICYDPGDPDFAAPRSCVTTYNELYHPQAVARDGFGRVIIRSEWNDGVEQRTYETYDALDRVVQTTDAAGNVATYSWDSLNRKLAMCDPDLGCWSYAYDEVGELVAQTDAKGQTVTFTHDALGRVLTKTYPDGKVVELRYDEAGHGDSNGKVTTRISQGVRESLTYDANGNATSQARCVLGVCYTMNQTYDALGRVTSVTYPDGEVVSYTFNAEGNLATASGYIDSVQYNASGQITALTYANGTTQTYDYDPSRQWLRTSQVSKGANTLYQASYTYNANSRVTQMRSSTHLKMNVDYAYDDLNRLVSVNNAQTQTFAYDAIGNMTYNSKLGSYSYADPNHAHAVTSAGENSYTYDANGNMTSGGGRTLRWDVDNQPVAITHQGVTTNYLYNADGERVAKIAAAGTTRYYGRLLQLEPECAGGPTKFIFAGSLRVARKNSSGTHFYHTDHLGSVRLITDSTGTEARTTEYEAYGAVVSQTGSLADDHQFGGHRGDSESGLVYMKARYYDPDLGRFLAADSVVPDPDNPQALNRYSFGYNNPISNRDPTGHAPVAVAVMAVVGVIGAEVSTAVLVATIIGAACSIAGYFLESPILMTIGSICLGYASGGVLGAVVAAATSPLSPLDPKLKMAIGWAYTAYGIVSAQLQANKTLKELKTDTNNAADFEHLTADEVGRMGFKDPEKAMMAARVISKDAAGTTMREVLQSAADTGKEFGLGMVGPGDGWFAVFLDKTVGQIPGVQLHGILHDAYGLTYRASAGLVGPGYPYMGKLPFMPTSSPLTGQVMGLYRNNWLSALNMTDIGLLAAKVGAGLDTAEVEAGWTFEDATW